MAWLMRKSIAVEDSPMVHWTPETTDEILKANASVAAQFAHLPADHPDYQEGGAAVGHSIPLPNRPYEAIIEELHGSLPDALTSSIVNNRIRQAVEAIEPSVHQFIPTNVILPDGTRDDTWWTMHICHRVDALALEYCVDVFKYNPKPIQCQNLYYYRSNEDNRMRLAIHKDRVAGMAIWLDWRFRQCFFSEVLGQYFIDNDIRGYSLPGNELNHTSHVIEV